MRAPSEPQSEPPAEHGFPTPAWQPILLGAAAGALGWGIRGQYGHETGAMIAGLLVSLTWAALLLRSLPSQVTLRAVAWTTVAIGFGGAMTYGQTIGLTQDAPLVGNHAALAWGLLGLALKGGIWIGFAGLFLGMSLGGVRYRHLELAGLFTAMLLLFAAGTTLLDSPFNPQQRILPAIYFSADWRWLPDATTLKPRREVWGGLLFALIGAVTYAAAIRQDTLARRLALWAALGGALGFPAGQCLQAFHAWNQPLFHSGPLATLAPFINWWNFMETTFGAIFGAVLGFGLWRNRHVLQTANRLQPPPTPATAFTPNPSGSTPTSPWPILAVALHTTLVMLSEFTSIPVIEQYTDLPLILGILPILACLHSRTACWLVALPVTLIPIAAKTVRYLAAEQQAIPFTPALVLYLVLPIAAAALLAITFARRSDAGPATSARSVRLALAFSTVLYFSLNYAFFRFPWPWTPWTIRTPNALVFAACSAALLWLAWRDPAAPRPSPTPPRPEVA